MSKHSVTNFSVITTIQYTLAFIFSFFLTECLPKVGTFMRIILSDPAKSGPDDGAWIEGYDYQNKDKTHYHFEK